MYKRSSRERHRGRSRTRRRSRSQSRFNYLLQQLDNLTHEIRDHTGRGRRRRSRRSAYSSSSSRSGKRSRYSRSLSYSDSSQKDSYESSNPSEVSHRHRKRPRRHSHNGRGDKDAPQAPSKEGESGKDTLTPTDNQDVDKDASSAITIDGATGVVDKDAQPPVGKDSEQSSTVPDTELLSLLGEIPSPNGPLGPDIHDAVAERWLSILKGGLSKEDRLDLLKKYPPAKNCEPMKAPILNPEVKSALNSTSIKKDTFQVLAQSKISASLAAIGGLLTSILQNKEKTDTAKLTSGLSDAGKILADLHHSISISRRQVILMNLNPIAKRIADDSKIDTLLFGANFSEALKSAETIEKSTKIISKTATRQSSSYQGTSSGRSYPTRPSGGSLNSKLPLRKKSSRMNSQRESQKSRTSYRR